MDVQNAFVVMDFFNQYTTSIENSSLTNHLPKKHPTGIPDYQLMVLYEHQRTTLLIILSILIFLSILGNVATIIFNLRSRKIKPFFRTCLLSLALSDLITTIIQPISYISQLTVTYSSIWTLGEVLCTLIPFMTTLAIFVSSLALVGIAIDRYMVVIKVIETSWKPGALFCTTSAILIWGFAAGISSPMMLSYFILDFFVMETDPNDHTIFIDVYPAELCTSDKGPNSIYVTVIFVLIFLPILFVFVLLNSILALEIWHRRRPIITDESSNACCNISNDDNSTDKRAMTNESNTVSGQLNTKSASNKNQTITTTSSQTSLSTFVKKIKTNREIRQLRMFRVIVMLMLTFLVCRLPTWIFLLYKLHNLANTNLHWMLHYSFGLLSIFNCVLNPFLYTFLSESIHYSSMCLNRLTILFGCNERVQDITNNNNNCKNRKY